MVRRRSAVLTLLLVLSTATAGAVIGRRVIGRRLTPPVRDEHAVVVARSVVHHRSPKQPPAPRQPAAPAEVAVVPESKPSADVAAAVEPRRHAAGHSSRGTDRPPPDRSVTRSVVEEQAAHQLLVDAMFALRRARDFRRAGALLDDYLTKYPAGALREEAIALAVEAAAAATDLARRDHWASVYLKEYPAGRFRAFVAASRGK